MRIRRRRCRTLGVVQAMLFAWIFAIAAGWVNACLLQGPATARGHHGQQDPVALLVAHGHAATAVPDHDGEPDSAIVVCSSFCDQQQGTIPKLNLAVLDELDAGHAVPSGVPWPSWRGSASGPGRRLVWRLHSGPSLVIRFLRLVL